MVWEIEAAYQFKVWCEGLNAADDDAVSEAIGMLEQDAPGLGRPLVDTLTGSRLANLMELRPKRNGIRILFVLDPRRAAILLLGGSKTNDWRGWYARNIPIAEQVYAEHLEELRKEGLL